MYALILPSFLSPLSLSLSLSPSLFLSTKLLFSTLGHNTMSGLMFFGSSPPAGDRKLSAPSSSCPPPSNDIDGRKMPPAAGASDSDKNRADSPDSGGGGYFTLSDSDLGTESPQEEVETTTAPSAAVTKSNTLYKIFRGNGLMSGRSKSGDNRTAAAADSKSGSRSRSETPARGGGIAANRQTPPRPSPPRDYLKKSSPPLRPSPPRSLLKSAKSTPRKSDDDGDTPPRGRKNEEVAPPRPPPPTSYTSTLPPPVPKKVGKAGGGPAKFSSKTLPARKVSTPKQKLLLEKVQPLQVGWSKLR